ncbi:hypothetical protein PF005_g3782 [Phytophthora fragariae]|uniref:RxLR effector protein n=1 Tax=Phytophthora fragariae TaxID=53985 RepID=A0A6A3Z358_9STRA|nr:hypothetical protein PF003_g16701 [Phytophthora fragariae]KAE8946436.1 hypothetical protein PF009_g3923 [Phytophthora fragariae]KAE8998019.1 hypothetical protein PF011_g15228 [Phytophthora fragariae]KAE9097986.1 hypothetical protein PF010_g15745 [Phytophthora fragariae]KAE9132851.1 hypothetical protein PF007_g3577 [Phytophthora fragariae]
MKFAAFAITAIVVLASVVAGADPMPAVLPPSKALEAAQSASAPEGVEFTGSVEKIEQPAGAKETINALQTTHDDADGGKKEQFGWGAGYGAGYGWGLGGWSNWGGWGGFGPYRFGFQCGGVPGWAYPLSYWNLFGAGLYGGSCGLGMPFGGLYYC